MSFVGGPVCAYSRGAYKTRNSSQSPHTSRSPLIRLASHCDEVSRRLEAASRSSLRRRRKFSTDLRMHIYGGSSGARALALSVWCEPGRRQLRSETSCGSKFAGQAAAASHLASFSHASTAVRRMKDGRRAAMRLSHSDFMGAVVERLAVAGRTLCSGIDRGSIRIIGNWG